MPGRSEPKRRPGKTPARFGWLRDVPPWLSAVAALAATILTALGVFGLVTANPPTTPAINTPAAEATPLVIIDNVLVGPQQVEAQGIFENVDPTIEDVLFVGRPAASTTDVWVAVEAALAPRSQIGPLQSGRWTASRPAPTDGVAYRWRAIIWPSASGATGNEDLQRNGPDSEFVVARSEEWLTE